jgi:3-oxoacyl-[acyl-carrier-protein] synthase-3
MTKQNISSITGFGHATPENVIHNAHIENALGLDPGWIEQRTGIRTRHWARENDTLTGLAESAGRMALKNAGCQLTDIGMVILATSTPDHLLPPSAPLLAHRLGLTGAGAVDVAGACSGFIYALAMADALVRVHGRSVLVVAANILSRRINMKERASAVMFGDAAGAAVISPTANGLCRLLSSTLTSDGSHYDLIGIPVGQTHMTMRDGRTLFTQAVKTMVVCGNKVLQEAEINPAEVQHFIPHQANARIFDSVAKQLFIEHATIARTIQNYGNSSAATIPLSLSLAQDQKAFHPNDHLLLTAAGAGLTGGAALLQYSDQSSA